MARPQSQGFLRQFKELTRGFPVTTGSSRQNQQLGPIGVGIGVLAIYDEETLRSTVSQMHYCQNALVAQLESLTTDNAKFAKKIRNFKVQSR